MMIVGIDPGPKESAFAKLCKQDGEWTIIDAGKVDNFNMLPLLEIWAQLYSVTFVIEMVASYGMPVGKDVFETVRWIGRFDQMVGYFDKEAELVYRKDIKMMLCDRTNAKDANIRRALIDRWGPVGTSKNKGPTFGFSGDMWSALAVATYWIDKQKMDAYEARLKEFKLEDIPSHT